MNGRSLKACIWAGPLAGVFFGTGLWPLAGFIPLVDPQLGAGEIASFYQSNSVGIRLGGMAIMFSASVQAAFFGAIYVFVRRIEGGNGPLAITQAMSGALLAAFAFLPAMLFMVTAFRLDRPEEITYLMSDIAWLLLIVPTPPGIVQALAIGFAILGDKSPRPLLPRYCGYMSLWMAVLTIPAPLAALFYSGPFAWNGILAFWIPAGIAGVWMVVMVVAMLKAADRAVETPAS